MFSTAKGCKQLKKELSILQYNEAFSFYTRVLPCYETCFIPKLKTSVTNSTTKYRLSAICNFSFTFLQVQYVEVFFSPST